MLQAQEAAHHDGAADHEHDRERDLGDHEGTPGAQASARAGHAVRAVLERAVQVRPLRVHDRREAEQQRGEHRAADRERDRRTVERDLARARRRARDQRGHAVDGPHRDQDAEAAAEQAEQQALGDELPHEPAPARAERVTDRDLARARLGARQQQICDVDDRDQQHEQHGTLQQPERLREATDEVRVKRHADHRVPRRQRVRAIRARRRRRDVGGAAGLLRPGLAQGDQLRLQRLERLPVAEPHDDVKVVATAAPRVVDVRG